ncbi:TatD family hydrolase [Patescibacteria group bacterium]|nr:TatD family hydrolase [Patescibacteria group bacterium]MCL5091513.1 TatD family hydrolase [Patescibacteria group bacterium]
MFDTHCHLNFKALRKNVSEVIDSATRAGVTHLLVPGTDDQTSSAAATIASQYDNVYAAVGIHPHHASVRVGFPDPINAIEKLLQRPKVVAIGEVGLDYFIYQKTKYDHYVIDQDFADRQKQLLVEEIKLALKHDKSLILHNREAKHDLLPLLESHWDKRLEGKTVFHCCEPDDELLDFAVRHRIYVGVDGDITYNQNKQEFIKKVPLDLLVLETDSPFLLPEPLRSQKQYPNQPANIVLINRFVSTALNLSEEALAEQTTHNAKLLFSI